MKQKSIGITKLIITVAMLLSLILAGCEANTTTVQSNSQSTIDVGLVLPLTGEAASWGQNALAGITLATNEINGKGGINGQTVRIIVEDDRCSTDGVAAFQKLANFDKVTAILGPICSASAGPAVPIAQEAGVPVILVAASAPHLTIGKDYIFRVYPSDSFQGKSSAEFIFNTLQKKKVAVLYVQNDWGQGIRDVFVPEFKSLGGQVVYDTGVSQDEKDMKTQIIKIKESGADVVYIPVYPANAIVALKQIKELNLNVPIVGGDTLDTDEVVKSGYAEDVIYMVPKIDSPEAFKQKINAISGFSNLEVGIAAPLGYDAANVLFEAVKRAGTYQPALRAAIADTDIKGVSNPKINFNENGDLINVQLEFKIVKNSERQDYS